MFATGDSRIEGIVAAIVPGPLNSTLEIETGEGLLESFAIATEALATIKIAVGDRLTVIVKEGAVIVGK